MPERSPKKLAAYDALIASHPDIPRKGKTMPYTSLNGNMFTILGKDGTMGLRLDKENRQSFIEEHNTKLFESHGAVMREYVAVPDKLLQDTAKMKKYLDLSYQYVQTLKPKPTKKK